MRPRAIFSDAALARYTQTDQPIRATDPITGIALIYRFDDARGGVLTCFGGPLDQAGPTSREVPVRRLNRIARRLCDRLARRSANPRRCLG